MRSRTPSRVASGSGTGVLTRLAYHAWILTSRRWRGVAGATRRRTTPPPWWRGHKIPTTLAPLRTCGHTSHRIPWAWRHGDRFPLPSAFPGHDAAGMPTWGPAVCPLRRAMVVVAAATAHQPRGGASAGPHVEGL